MARFVTASSKIARSFRRRLPKNTINLEATSPTGNLKGSTRLASSKKEVSAPIKGAEGEVLGKATPSPETPKLAVEPPLTNPFNLLAHATENVELASRLRAFANNFGVIGALWCTLSIGALSMAPIDDVYKNTERIENASPEGVDGKAVLVKRRTLVPHSPQRAPDGRRRKPVLVKYFGMTESVLEDIYMACWSASFYFSAIGLGLSTVVAGIVASTAPAYVKVFVRRHSNILTAIPMCQALSSGFAGIGLAVGLDEARGEPVSYIGYFGTIGAGYIVGSATLNVLKGYKTYRAAGKLVTPPPTATPQKPQ